MGNCLRNIRQLDPDDVFSYNTIKVVRVRDRYLGLLRYEVPIGTTNLSLLKPNKTFSMSEFSYCLQYVPSHARSSQHHYADPLNCTIWDASQVVFPDDQYNSMFITTRVKHYKEKRICPEYTDCKTGFVWQQDGPAESVYMANVETFTIRVEHSMQAQKLFRETRDHVYSRSSSQMDGRMVDVDGNVVMKFYGDQMDIVSLETFLTASGIDLSANTSSIGHNPGETIRHAGQVIMVVISYSNFDDLSNPTYTFYPAPITGQEYKITESIRISDSERQIVDRHGVKIVFVASGELGKFDFQTLLVQGVSALGLLSVATLVVELLMLYILPQRNFYNKYKFEETVDFSDLRDVESSQGAFTRDLNADLADLRHMPLRTNKPDSESDDKRTRLVSYI